MAKVTVSRWVVLTMPLLLASGCDGYKYNGMDGRQALAKANGMPLPDAYSFYLATYEGVSPPMLDVAETFRRFGPEGTAYVSRKALQTQDKEEFDADLEALLILDYQCPKGLTGALAARRQTLDARVSPALVCGSGV